MRNWASDDCFMFLGMDLAHPGAYFSAP